MKTHTRINTILLILMLVSPFGWAQRGPQDTWYLDSSITPSGVSGIDSYDLIATNDGKLLIADIQGDRIIELERNGTFLRNLATSGTGDGFLKDPREISIAPNGNLYVTDFTNHRIQVFQRDGTFVRKFSQQGSGDGELDGPWGIAVSQSGEVFVADMNNHRIQVFDLNGTFLRKWGTQGNLEGQLNKPRGLDLDDDGSVLVIDYENKRLVVFSPSGQYLRKWTIGGSGSKKQYATTVANLRNGLLYVGGGAHPNVSPNQSVDLRALYESSGSLIKYLQNDAPWPSKWASATSFPDGTIVVADRDNDKLNFYRPTYRTFRPANSKHPPLPEIVSVVQRPGTNYLDITFRINDADSPNVEVGILGFVDGGNDLDKVVVPKTFVGSTVGKLGQNVPTGQNHLVTWDAGTDWNVGFGEIEMEVLAKDDRDLLNIHYLTLPATDSNSTELKISRSPVSDANLLSLWYWLLSTDQIQLSGLTGLASGTNTTVTGENYLLNLMNLRKANASEISRAKEGGTPGIVNKFEPTFKVGPRETPNKINEYGFETQNSNGFWVIPN